MSGMFVVCHMLASLDGKIDGAFFGAAEAAPALKAYGDLRDFYGCQATLYGTTTMLGAMLTPDGHSLATVGVTVMDELFRSLVEEYSGNDLPIQKARH